MFEYLQGNNTEYSEKNICSISCLHCSFHGIANAAHETIRRQLGVIELSQLSDRGYSEDN